MRRQLILRSEEETARAAAILAGALRAGDVIFLKGPLGAGKTFFIRAAAGELGVAAPVISPSFTLARTYSGNVTVHHLDLYRLSAFGSHDDAELEPYFGGDCVTFIEWPEPVEGFIEPDATVIMEHLDRNSRRMTIEGEARLLSGFGRS